MLDILNILSDQGGCQSGGCSSGGCGSSDALWSEGSSACGCSGGGPADLVAEDGAQLRRDFLKNASSIVLGSVTLTLLPGSLGAADKAAGATAASGDSEPLYGFLVDTDKCIGAGKCLTACREENNVPEGQARTWVERYIHFKDGNIQVDLVPEVGYTGEEPEIDPETVDKAYFVPKLCNHCADAPCNQVCPTHASITAPGGVELVDPDLCIGCAYCVQACPYGVRFINHETGNADKCTWCYHRITQDQTPACVEACPTGARLFGRLDDPNSEISQKIRSLPNSVLKEHLGTHPKLHYIGLNGEVV